MQQVVALTTKRTVIMNAHSWINDIVNKGGFIMYRHLTIRDRILIQYTIEHLDSKSLSSLAEDIRCHRSTIYREIKRNCIVKSSKTEKFLKSVPVHCIKVNSFPFVCNNCSKINKCAKRVIVYDAYEADKKAFRKLKDTRKHCSLSKSELNILNAKISPRIKCHQSIYHILKSDSSITLSESTIRRYIDNRYLECLNIDLPRTVRFRAKTPAHKIVRKRINVELLVNRTYSDYVDYSASAKRVTLQLDTIYGKKSDSMCILTIFEPTTRFQWGYLIRKSANAVNEIVNKLVQTFKDNNCLFFDCILTDNGSEFSSLPTLEVADDGTINFRVFYCDPYASYQKGGCERNHELFRYCYKKGDTFDFLSQDELDNVFSYINSLKRKALSGNSALQSFRKHFSAKALNVTGIIEVQPDKLTFKK